MPTKPSWPADKPSWARGWESPKPDRAGGYCRRSLMLYRKTPGVLTSCFNPAWAPQVGESRFQTEVARGPTRLPSYVGCNL